MSEKCKSIWRIPCFRRFTNTYSGFCFNCKVVVLDSAVGKFAVFVHYKDEKELDPKNISMHLIGVEHKEYLEEGDTKEDAVRNFYQRIGATEGTAIEEHRALWIDRKKDIFKEPDCDRRYFSKSGHLICGQENIEEENGNGEFGGCYLDGCSAPDFDDCPYWNY